MLFKDRLFSWTSWTFSGKLMFKKVWSDLCFIQSSYLIWPLFRSVFLSYSSSLISLSSCVVWYFVSVFLCHLILVFFWWSSCVIWSLFHSSSCVIWPVSVFLCYLTSVSAFICYLVLVSFRLPVLFGPCFVQTSCVIWSKFHSVFLCCLTSVSAFLCYLVLAVSVRKISPRREESKAGRWRK